MNSSVLCLNGITTTSWAAFAIDIQGKITYTSTCKKGVLIHDREALEAALGASYVWMGWTLGGKGRVISVDAIDRLASEEGDVALLCMEHHPCNCHRYFKVALPLYERHGIDAMHLFESREVPT